MGKTLRIIVCSLAVVVPLAGCASSPWASDSSMPRQGAPATTTAPAGAPTAAPVTPKTAPSADSQMPDPVALQSIMNELQQIGAVDPAGRDQLLADMQQTDPALWPLVLQHFRAAVAYRQRAQQQDRRQMVAQAGAGPLSPATAAAGYPPQPAPTQPRIGRPAPPAAPAPGRFAPATVPPSSGEQPMPAAPTALPNGASPPALSTSSAAPQPTQPGPPAASTGPSAAPTSAAGPSASATPSPPPTEPALSSVPQPVSASKSTPHPADNWNDQLASAARALEMSLPANPQTPEEVAQHARLRMLQLLAGQRDRALKPIPSATPSLQQFWLKELYGLSTWLDAERNPDDLHRAAEAKRVLAEAVGRLAETAPLVVSNLAFCTEVKSYGNIVEFSENEFKPNQVVLLYAEVENFSSEETSRGFHTSMRSSYQIFDSRGQQVVQQDFPVTEEFCRKRRRDFFIGHQMRMPERIYDGRHTLKLTIEDLNSKKIGQASIEFWVVGSDK